jgi:thiol-disulfide isomerase/thioredoxin
MTWQKSLVSLLVLLIAVFGIYGLAKRESIRNKASKIQTVPADAAEAQTNPMAAEFAAGTWINSEPLTLKSLRGRVVLIEFWTFGCYNCRNTLPFVKRWHESYGDKGLTIVGVHSPEFAGERNIDNVRREVGSLGIKYPVVTDNDYETWKAYDVEAWPTLFVLDKTGRVRWTHVGEGSYDVAEQTIQKLLAEAGKENDASSQNLPR